MTLGLAWLSLALSGADLQPATTADLERQFQRWESRLRARVAELHYHPEGVAKNSIGDVVISFSIGPDGRPTDLVIKQSSGSALFDRSAHRLVRLLGPVGPVPTMTGKPHPIVLKLSYGEKATAAADRELADTLNAEREERKRRNLEIVSNAGRQVSER